MLRPDHLQHTPAAWWFWGCHWLAAPHHSWLGCVLGPAAESAQPSANQRAAPDWAVGGLPDCLQLQPPWNDSQHRSVRNRRDSCSWIFPPPFFYLILVMNEPRSTVCHWTSLITVCVYDMLHWLYWISISPDWTLSCIVLVHHHIEA